MARQPGGPVIIVRDYSGDKLMLVPLSLNDANALVKRLHRHHKPVVGHKFSIGVRGKDSHLCGAVIVGRPVSREINANDVAEVTRLVTDGTPNACSILYAAAARCAAAMGYIAIQTYVLEEEPGTTLRAAGWQFDGLTSGGDWNNAARGGARRTDQPMGRKQRWVKLL